MRKKMKAALLYGPLDLRIEEIEPPAIDRDQALINIHACGICPSDVRAFSGIRKAPRGLPYTPGHEWVGHIVEIGKDVSGFSKGDRVVPDWRAICGKCYYCSRGIFNYCENLSRGLVRGGFCEYGYSAESNLHIIPESVSYEEACFTEPLACCINGTRSSNIQIGDDVVIVGSGPIGLLHLQLAKHQGARAISCDLIPERLEKAKNMGADEVILASQGDPVERVMELTEGRGANAVIVAVGGRTPIEQGIKMAGICATVNLFAGTYPPAEMTLDPNIIHYKQLSVTGSHDYTPNDFTLALKLLANKTIRVKPLISHILPLEKAKEGFEIVMQRKGLKVVVKTS